MFTKQIYAKNFIIKFFHFLKMFQKRLFCFLMTVIEFNFRINSSLFPKHWHRPSNLKMRKTVIIYENNLFSFTEIGNMTFVGESSIVISSSSFFPRSSGNQIIIDLFSYIILVLPWRIYLKFLIEPCINIMNHDFYCNFSRFFPILQFQANLIRGGYPYAYAVLDKLS